MSLLLAIEPDRRQASRVTALARNSLQVEIVIGETTESAFAALGARVPDLVLTSLLLSPKDETALADRLRELDAAGKHVQTLVIPVLGAGDESGERSRGGIFGRLLRSSAKPSTDGCDPAVFGSQITEYLERAAAERAAAAEAQADLDAAWAEEPKNQPQSTSQREEPQAASASFIVAADEAPVAETNFSEHLLAQLAPLPETSVTFESHQEPAPASPSESWTPSSVVAFDHQEPAFTTPEPTFTSPEPVFTTPEPAFEVPEPVYAEPATSFASPEPSFASSAASFAVHEAPETWKEAWEEPAPAPAAPPARTPSPAPLTPLVVSEEEWEEISLEVVEPDLSSEIVSEVVDLDAFVRELHAADSDVQPVVVAPPDDTPLVRDVPKPAAADAWMSTVEIPDDLEVLTAPVDAELAPALPVVNIVPPVETAPAVEAPRVAGLDLDAFAAELAIAATPAVPEPEPEPPAPVRPSLFQSGWQDVLSAIRRDISTIKTPSPAPPKPTPERSFEPLVFPKRTVQAPAVEPPVAIEPQVVESVVTTPPVSVTVPSIVDEAAFQPIEIAPAVTPHIEVKPVEPPRVEIAPAVLRAEPAARTEVAALEPAVVVTTPPVSVTVPSIGDKTSFQPITSHIEVEPVEPLRVEIAPDVLRAEPAAQTEVAPIARAKEVEVASVEPAHVEIAPAAPRYVEPAPAPRVVDPVPEPSAVDLLSSLGLQPVDVLVPDPVFNTPSPEPILEAFEDVHSHEVIDHESAAAAGSAKRSSKSKKKRKQESEKPAKASQVDDWGFFDPQKVGFATLVARLNEITEREEHGSFSQR